MSRSQLHNSGKPWNDDDLLKLVEIVNKMDGKANWSRVGDEMGRKPSACSQKYKAIRGSMWLIKFIAKLFIGQQSHANLRATESGDTQGWMEGMLGIRTSPIRVHKVDPHRLPGGSNPNCTSKSKPGPTLRAFPNQTLGTKFAPEETFFSEEKIPEESMIKQSDGPVFKPYILETETGAMWVWYTSETYTMRLRVCLFPELLLTSER